jgi:hypothetical protein
MRGDVREHLASRGSRGGISPAGGAACGWRPAPPGSRRWSASGGANGQVRAEVDGRVRLRRRQLAKPLPAAVAAARPPRRRTLRGLASPRQSAGTRPTLPTRPTRQRTRRNGQRSRQSRHGPTHRGAAASVTQEAGRDGSTRIYRAHRPHLDFPVRLLSGEFGPNAPSWPRGASQQPQVRGKPWHRRPAWPPQLMIIFGDRVRLPRLSAGKIAFG